MFGQISKFVPKSVFCPQPVGGKRPEEVEPNFSNISHKWMCVQLWLRSLQWPQRLGVEKKERRKKTTAV